MEGGGAYGAGRAGAPFNPVTFIKKPEVIVRLIALVRFNSLNVVLAETKSLYKIYNFYITFVCLHLHYITNNTLFIYNYTISIYSAYFFFKDFSILFAFYFSHT